MIDNYVMAEITAGLARGCQASILPFYMELPHLKSKLQKSITPALESGRDRLPSAIELLRSTVMQWYTLPRHDVIYLCTLRPFILPDFLRFKNGPFLPLLSFFSTTLPGIRVYFVEFYARLYEKNKYFTPFVLYVEAAEAKRPRHFFSFRQKIIPGVRTGWY